jgi:hypothetical protein
MAWAYDVVGRCRRIAGRGAGFVFAGEHAYMLCLCTCNHLQLVAHLGTVETLPERQVGGVESQVGALKSVSSSQYGCWWFP